MPFAKLLCFSILCVNLSVAMAETSANTQWQTATTSDDSFALPRHESGAVSVNGKLYLFGGRGERAVQMFDPASATWTELGPMPLELHHFQPVAIDDLIYVIGSYTCCFPNEPSIADIHVFNTTTLSWSVSGSMPASRVRGSTAAVVRDKIIYVLGGNTLGHSGGAVAWFDSYNPATGAWSVLPDAPNKRDHFNGVIVSDYLVAAAGRQTARPNTFKNAVAATDMYDFLTGEWSSADPIPTLRAGALAGAAGDEIVVAGGEIDTSSVALSNVEAMNVYTRQWRALAPLGTGRHSGAGIVLDGNFHVIAGSLKTGGAPETSVHETLQLEMASSVDFDADGLSNIDERAIHGTDPVNNDTDADFLNDKQELTQYGSNPLAFDTDQDGIDDGTEVTLWNTNPAIADTDGEGLIDYDEAYTYNTNPLDADTDADNLNDKLEVVDYNTDPANKDTDADGFEDGDEVQAGTDPRVAEVIVAGSTGGSTGGATEGSLGSGTENASSGPIDSSEVNSTGGSTGGLIESSADDEGSVDMPESSTVSVGMSDDTVGSVSAWLLVALFSSSIWRKNKTVVNKMAK